MVHLCIAAGGIGAAVFAQGQHNVEPTARAFDVISIRPMAPDRQDRFDSYCVGGGRFISRGTPLLWAIKWAYGLNDYQVASGWPDWLNAFETYEIEAESERRVTEDQCKTMLRSLFEERFKLRMHPETKTVSAYALVVGKNGHKLRDRGRVTINGSVKQDTSEREPPDGWTMARLANYLADVRGIDRPVLDRTGIAGLHGFTLDYSTREGDDRPDIFTAVRAQLGLKLQSIKAPIEIFVIDRVEKPSGNY